MIQEILTWDKEDITELNLAQSVGFIQLVFEYQDNIDIEKFSTLIPWIFRPPKKAASLCQHLFNLNLLESLLKIIDPKYRFPIIQQIEVIKSKFRKASIEEANTYLDTNKTYLKGEMAFYSQENKDKRAQLQKKVEELQLKAKKFQEMDDKIWEITKKQLLEPNAAILANLKRYKEILREGQEVLLSNYPILNLVKEKDRWDEFLEEKDIAKICDFIAKGLKIVVENIDSAKKILSTNDLSILEIPKITDIVKARNEFASPFSQWAIKDMMMKYEYKKFFDSLAIPILSLSLLAASFLSGGATLPILLLGASTAVDIVGIAVDIEEVIDISTISKTDIRKERKLIEEEKVKSAKFWVIVDAILSATDIAKLAIKGVKAIGKPGKKILRSKKTTPSKSSIETPKTKPEPRVEPSPKPKTPPKIESKSQFKPSSKPKPKIEGKVKKKKRREKGYVKKSVKMAEKEGLTKKREILQVEEYRDAPKVREARGTTGALEEAAHISPASILEKNFPNYNRRYDLTTLLPPEVHYELDKTWKIWVNKLKKENKREVLVRDFMYKIFEAIDNTQKLIPQEKGAMQQIVFETLYRNLGAQPDDILIIW